MPLDVPLLLEKSIKGKIIKGDNSKNILTIDNIKPIRFIHSFITLNRMLICVLYIVYFYYGLRLLSGISQR